MVYPEGFWVIQCFDHEGYHHCILAHSQSEAQEKATKFKGVACSLPYIGMWDHKHGCFLPDVSLPFCWKADLACLEKGNRE